MLKAYISGRITGDDNYLRKFTQAELYLTKQGFSVINPAAALILFPKDTKYIEYMCNSLRLLDTCDCIYMLKDWEYSHGAKIEHEYALATDKSIIYEMAGATYE